MVFDHRTALDSFAMRDFGRCAFALGRAKGAPSDAKDFARGAWEDGEDIANKIGLLAFPTLAERHAKGAVLPALANDSGWADYLAMSRGFVQSVRAASILGRINARPSRFNRAGLVQTVATSAQWVASGSPKPVIRAEFAGLSLPVRKVSSIYVVGEDVFNTVTFDAETAFLNDLRGAVVEHIDTTFASDDAAVSGESPAGIANNAVTVSATGSTVAQISADLRSMIDVQQAAGLNPSAWILSTAANALYRLLKVSDPDGGLAGLPVVVSNAAAGSVLLVDASRIAVAMDDAVQLTATRDATIELSDSPTGSGTFTSLFQKNLIALLAEMHVNWSVFGPEDSNGQAAVVTLTGATYA